MRCLYECKASAFDSTARTRVDNFGHSMLIQMCSLDRSDVGVDRNKILKCIFKLQTLIPGTVHYCSGSDAGLTMYYYHNVSIFGGSIK